MKRQIQIGITSLLLALGTAVQVHAQNLIQRLNVSLTGNDPATGKTFSIKTADMIRYFVGTNVPGAQLELVTPVGNPPGTTGNLNAWLRIVKGGEIVMEVTSPDEFNLYQDTAALTTSGTSIMSHAINRFSIAFGDLPYFELQGFSTWHIAQKTVNGVDISGSGSFSSAVNGILTVGDGPQDAPVRGTITAGPPTPGA
jgi:hypothetical protein